MFIKKRVEQWQEKKPSKYIQDMSGSMTGSILMNPYFMARLWTPHRSGCLSRAPDWSKGAPVVEDDVEDLKLGGAWPVLKKKRGKSKKHGENPERAEHCWQPNTRKTKKTLAFVICIWFEWSLSGWVQNFSTGWDYHIIWQARARLLLKKATIKIHL